MNKRLISFFLCVWVLISLALPAAAQEEETRKMHYTITSVESFLQFAEKCRLDRYSQNLLVSLKTDLDLGGIEFPGIPVFCGTFEGNGHRIRGLDLSASGSYQGLFRYLTDTAVVQDLKVEGFVRPEGSRSKAGGIAGSNAGKILNCTFRGTVSGNSGIGGLVGVNEVSGILEGCSMHGSVYGSHFVGGIAGENSGVIRDCENNAQVNDTAQQNSVELTDITLESLTGAEAVNTVTDIGGIAGISTGVIRVCINYGDIGYRHMGYNIGGIAGTQSGMILSCQNHGEIQGRKEVGGIVGQMEPAAMIQYEEDALQVLQSQLDDMGATLNKTMSNLEGTTDKIVSQVDNLQTHVRNAQDAMDTLLPDGENPQLPDQDTIQAAYNNISSSISGMTQSLQGMNATAYGAMGAVSTNLHALQRQIDSMRTALGNVSETLGGSITDVSDRDTDVDLSGKVNQCVNHGSVLADRNAGGIAGAMALENDLDPEEDWKISGSNSLNFESELRAVILNCANLGEITVKKMNAGGIVGWQSMGLVKGSLNSGTLDGAAADYVGGISGQSGGFIRNCGAKCEISGSSYVGGIAGSADVVTDCRSMVKLAYSGEKAGAILGISEAGETQTEDPISGNLYLCVFRDPGGIDGISYDRKAQPMDRESFLALEELPEMFRKVAVRFRYPNGTLRSFSVSLGEGFSRQWTPPLPPKEGYVASWEGLAEADLSALLFDATFEAQYLPQKTVIASDYQRDGQPVLLVQGSFSEDAQLALKQTEGELSLRSGESLLEVWSIRISGAEGIDTGRLRLPEGCDGEHSRVLRQDREGIWQSAAHTVEGSSLVFGLEDGDQGIALIRTDSISWLWVGAIGAALAAVAVCLWRLGAKRKK